MKLNKAQEKLFIDLFLGRRLLYDGQGFWYVHRRAEELSSETNMGPAQVDQSEVETMLRSGLLDVIRKDLDELEFGQVYRLTPEGALLYGILVSPDRIGAAIADYIEQTMVELKLDLDIVDTNCVLLSCLGEGLMRAVQAEDMQGVDICIQTIYALGIRRGKEVECD